MQPGCDQAGSSGQNQTLSNYSQAVSEADSFLTHRKMKAGVAPDLQCTLPRNLRRAFSINLAVFARPTRGKSPKYLHSFVPAEMRITRQAQARAAELSRRRQEQNDHIESLKADLFSGCRTRLSPSLSSCIQLHPAAYSCYWNQGIRRKPS